MVLIMRLTVPLTNEVIKNHLSRVCIDVNECGTQLVLCDINADCLDHYGSYSCRCRPGFRDESRLGSGGTTCVDVTAAGTLSDNCSV